MAEILKNKGGRPKKADDEAKRASFTFRTTGLLKEQLTAAAAQSERPIAQEIEMRLEMSFLEEKLVGSNQMALMLKLMAGTIMLIEQETSTSFIEDRSTWEAVRAAVLTILDNMQPQLDLEVWNKHKDTMWAFMEPAMELDKLNTRINGLAVAYGPLAEGEMPPEVKKIYDAALVERRALFEKVKAAAQKVFEGPLKEQSERSREMAEYGRQVASRRYSGPGKQLNWEVGQGQHGDLANAVGRMFLMSGGVVEPLDSLRDKGDLSDAELIDCIKKIATFGETKQNDRKAD